MLKFMVMILVMMISKTKNTKTIMMMVLIMFNMSMQNSSIQKMSYIYMGDLISFWNSNLSIWIIFILMFMKTKKQEFSMKILLIMLMIFITTFYTWNFMIFYVIFEMSMITMLVVVSSWSYQPERTEAMMFMVLMTMIFSLPFLLMMMMNLKHLNFWFIKMNINMWSYLSFLFVFMMKMPSYFMHFWLPKVHVEAPVQGSMILAAIMLKMGCYGMMRMMVVIPTFKKINMIIVTISMWSMVMLSAGCFIQTDIKTLIAYSSVVHMTLVLITLLINKTKSIFSSIITMLAHGMCASALFFMSNIIYKNSKSRSMLINKGSMLMMPMMPLLWFIGCMSNTPMPPFVSILGEIISFKLILEWTKMPELIFLMSLTSSSYSIYMFYIMIHGKMSKLTKNSFLIKVKTKMISIMQLSLLVLLSVKPGIMMIT